MNDHGIKKAMVSLKCDDKGSYNRMTHWSDFSNQVFEHIIHYTLPQYGDQMGNEQIDSFTTDDCFQSMLRYINRRKANVRGDKERLRDLIKISHYAQLAYDKLKAELGMEDVYGVQ